MTIKKPSTPEEEFIARQEAETRHRIAREKARSLADQERERLKALHFMKCPKCGFDLEETIVRGVRLDKCYHCNGMWLDEGELEQLAGKEHGFVRKLADIFGRRSTHPLVDGD